LNDADGVYPNMFRRFSLKRKGGRKTLVRDIGATRSEILECEGLKFGGRFNRDVRNTRNPEELSRVVKRWKDSLRKVKLPPPAVADIDQVKKDAQRDVIVINGRLFERRSEDQVRYLAKALTRTEGKSCTRGSRRLAQQILMRASRTVSGADSYFVCERLFSRPDFFHITPVAGGKPVPTIVEVVSETEILVRATNIYKITTHDRDGPGINIIEWCNLKTIICQTLDLEASGLTLRHKSRHIEISTNVASPGASTIPPSAAASSSSLPSSASHRGASSPVTLTKNASENDRDGDRKNARKILEVPKTVPPLVIRISEHKTQSVSRKNETSSSKDEDDADVDLLLPIEPPEPSPRSPQQSLEDEGPADPTDCDESYEVIFSKGPFGFGFRWIKGLGAVVEALRPGGQAEKSERIRLGDVVCKIGEVADFDGLGTFKKALEAHCNTRPLRVRFRRSRRGN